MTFRKILSDEQERALLVDHEDGWYVSELSIIYKISIRTVYRTLDRYGVSPNLKRRLNRPRVADVVPKELRPCGTNAAYARHKRKGEYPCTACLEAHAEDVAKAKVRNNGKASRSGRRLVRSSG